MINNNYQESFNQIQYLLNQLNNYVYKFNELINQINNIMNLLNNQFNDQMNKNNNLMNMMNINPMNINLKNFSNNEKKNTIYLNFQFESGNGTTYFYIDGNKTINDLINEYFRKINKFEYIDNYDKNFFILYNSKKINFCKDSKINEFFYLPDGNRIIVNEIYNK